MHERQFDWLTHALPLEKLNIFQLLTQAKHEMQHMKCNATEPQFSSVKDGITPFKVNGDPSTSTDQRIPARTCESKVTHTPSCMSSVSFTVPAALHSHLPKHTITHTWFSPYIYPSLPSLCVWSRRYMDDITVRDDQFRNRVFHSLDFLGAGFHPSKLPVHWLPTQQALFCSLVRVPSYSLGVSLVSVRLLVSPGLCSALLVTHFLSVLALDSVILFTYCLLLVSCSF